MTLQYRSKRRGFHFYVQGQTKKVADVLYNLKVDIKLAKQEVLFDTGQVFSKRIEITSQIRLASVAGAVIQAIGRLEFEDGLRTRVLLEDC